MSSPSPRWAAVKARVPGLKTAFGVGGVGAFWIDALGNAHEHYESSAFDLLEWFEKKLGIGANDRQTASERQEIQKREELMKAAEAYERQRYGVRTGPSIRASLGQPQPVEQPKPKQPVKPKPGPYSRKFG